MPIAVTVVIPVHNRARTIHRAVASVLRQTVADFELIVVDDGSTDDLGSTLAQFSDHRMRLVRNHRRQGPAAARNRGIGEAAGELVAFLDSDDEWIDDKLELQIAFMNDEPMNRLACCTGFHLHRSPGVDGAAYSPTRPLYRYRDLVSGCFLSPGTTLMARRDHFKEVGLFDRTLVRLEDWDWLLRSARIAPVAALRRPLAHVYRTGRPAPEAVAEAVERMRALHDAEAQREGGRAGARFRSALSLELAAAAFDRKQYLRSISLLGRSICGHPFRPPSFFAGLFRSLTGSLGSTSRR